MISRFFWYLNVLCHRLSCGVQRDTASDDSLQDPLLGYGDPYGGQDPPDAHTGDRAAPPAESIASKAT